LRHFAAIVPGGAMEVVDLYVKDFHRPDLALSAAKDNAAALEHLVELLGAGDADPALLESAKQSAADLRLRDADRDDADLGALIGASRIASDRHDHDLAIRYLRRAILIQPTDPNLRYQLAMHYHASNHDADAIRELHAAVGLRPDFREARDLLTQLEH